MEHGMVGRRGFAAKHAREEISFKPVDPNGLGSAHRLFLLSAPNLNTFSYLQTTWRVFTYNTTAAMK
jgi:hypothetical protein